MSIIIIRNHCEISFIEFHSQPSSLTDDVAEFSTDKTEIFVEKMGGVQTGAFHLRNINQRIHDNVFKEGSSAKNSAIRSGHRGVSPIGETVLITHTVDAGDIAAEQKRVG